jgi:signal transduction histidine kinase/ActR/RegA family two-component response regulator
LLLSWDIAFVLVGIVLFIAALAQYSQAYRVSQAQGLGGRWLGLGLFVVGFLVGYLLFIGYLLESPSSNPTNRLVSIVFLAGSAFVLACGRLFSSTTTELAELLEENEKQRDQLERQAEALSMAIDRKTLQLAKERERQARESSRTAKMKKERLEARLVAKQRQDGLATLVGGIAHDFNNLLVGILGNASFVRQLGPAEAQDFDEALADVEVAADRAAELTQHLNDYCGRGRTALDAMDLGALTSETLSLIRSSVDAKVLVVTDFQEELPLVWVEISRLQQVVINLTINGCEAILPATGTLSFRTGLIEVTEADLEADWMNEPIEPGSYVFLEVKDDGCGISRADQLQLFDALFSTKGIGRGLGLAAARKVARSHGGSLRVSSVEGEGTVATVILPPVSRIDESTSPEEEKQIVLRQREKVLVIDDELIVLDMIRRGLSRVGYGVDTANNESELLELMQAPAGEYTAAILDIMMPDIVFEKVFEELRARFPKIRIVVSSGYSDFETEEFLDKEALVKVLNKPYRVDQLIGALAEMQAKA